LNFELSMLSIKQKQVLGVTSIVALVVVGLSLLQLTTLARVLLQQSQERAEVLANTIYHRASEIVTSKDTAYDELRRDAGVQATLESAIYPENITYAAIVDTTGIVIAHNDRARIGERLPDADDLGTLIDENRITQLRTVYASNRTLEWRQPMLLDDVPFAEIRIGLSPILVRDELDNWLGPAAVTAAIALVGALVVAVLLSNIVLKPIHVIRSGLSRLGQGDLGATLDLKGEEFKDLGDVFASVSKQLRSALPAGAPRSQLLELSRRVASLGRLTAGVAHEVKNPLNAMTIHLELLKEKLVNGSGASGSAEHVDIIASEIRRLDDVVQGFLKFARPEELALQPTSPADIARDVLKMIEPEASAGRVVLHQNCAPDVPAIEADASILRQALVNLAKNAIQAMPNGGRLTVSCAATRDGRVEIRVTDTGVGIPPENLAKIFDLYYTTKTTGTGIGLSLVYRTIQLHNGDIDVESTPGVGTTFIIKMPAARGEVASMPPKSSTLTDLRKVENL
jgi:signal transduction histidine kinase